VGLYGMRMLAWNIRQGGGSRLARIADAVSRHEADVLVLSEYRGGEAAVRLRAALKTLGYRHATLLAPPPGRSGVLIAARCAFRDHGEVDGGLPEPYRMIGVEFLRSGWSASTCRTFSRKSPTGRR
jgi:exonuclease III